MFPSPMTPEETLRRLEEEVAAARERLAALSEDVFWSAHYRAGVAAGSVLELDYPVKTGARDFAASPHMRRLNALFEQAAPRFRDLLAGVAQRHAKRLRAIAVEAPADRQAPHWCNDWLPGLDGAAIYAFLADRNPRTYLEVGSGNSTKFARRAITDHGLRTRIVSIDPAPRAEVDAICDEMHRTGFEDFDLTRLEGLEAGDVVFVDNSHRAFSNSDVTVFFLDALGRLPKGCLYGLHDIFLPNDYPPEWATSRFYNEQYLLAAYLFGGADGDRVELPAAYVSMRPDLIGALDPLWSLHPQMPAHGGGFWLTKG